MLPIRKLYIDSRYALAGGTASNFSIQLDQSYYFPPNSVMYVDSVVIPTSYYMVQKGRSDTFYFAIGNTGADVVLQTTTLKEGNYQADTFVIELMKKINAFLVDSVSASYDIKLNSISIQVEKPELTLYIPSDAELLKSYGKSSPLNSVNAILRNYISKKYTSINPYICDYLDLYPIRNLFIHSNIGNNRSVHVNGQRSIIKEVPANAPYNSLIIDKTMLGSDYVEIGAMTLSILNFKLTNIYNEEIDLNGNHWCFNLVFAKVQPE